MTHRVFDAARWGVYFLAALWLLILVPLSAAAAPYAAMVVDARSGKVLHSENANTRLHPASLTKMMTLYIAFEAVENGEISLETLVKVSRKAASEPPSKLGLRAGQKIKLRYLLRAAAVKSANDAATAIGEAISGSEAAFARRMNRTAKAMGMTRTTFKNAHGLTESGHLSTARDMTVLGRHVIYDYKKYYNLFSRRTADAGIRNVSHTNRRLLDSYRGADGIKTGYTRAAGFNLVASAERGRERIIATVFGGRSTATRNARVAELLDLGFRRAPTRMALSRPKRPPYKGNRGIKAGSKKTSTKSVKVAGRSTKKPAAGKTIVVNLTLKKSLRPKARALPKLDETKLAAMQQDIQKALLAAAPKPDVKKPIARKVEPEATVVAAAPATQQPLTDQANVVDNASVVQVMAAAQVPPRVKPQTRPKTLVLSRSKSGKTKAEQPVVQERVQKVITRVSTSEGQHWGVNVGQFGSHYAAEKMLLKTALAEMNTLDGALRKVIKRKRGFDATFLGLTRDRAELACQRLQARNMTCFMVAPS